MGAEEEGKNLNSAGWAFLILSWGFILGLTVFCFYRVFTKKKID